MQELYTYPYHSDLKQESVRKKRNSRESLGHVVTGNGGVAGFEQAFADLAKRRNEFNDDFRSRVGDVVLDERRRSRGVFRIAEDRDRERRAGGCDVPQHSADARRFVLRCLAVVAPGNVR